jgi:N-acetylglucosamine-6-phosphate deacetylase
LVVTTLFEHARKLDARGQVDDFWMLVDGDTIVATGNGETPAADSRGDVTVDVSGQWLVPGFIDLHVHGGGGFAFDDGADAIASALATHRAHGTTRSLVSLVSVEFDQLKRNLGIVADLVASDPLVLGAHLEGPYLSPEYSAAHDQRYLREPQPADVEALFGASRGTLRQLTIAPELPNAFDAIGVLVEAGVAVAVGHTAADAALTSAAFDGGARLLTHAFNAMRGIHHRAPGPVIAAFDDDRVIIELILDGVHVHPDVARLVFASAPGRVAVVTDAMAAAGASDGSYELGGKRVSAHDGVAVIAGTDRLAGSTLTLDRALRVAIEQVGLVPHLAVEALTLTPARALGLEHRHGLLATGFSADAVLLDHAWAVISVWANGLQLS